MDCLYEALKLAQKIANSENGRRAYAKVNAAGADLSIELSDGNGPELKDNNLVGDYGMYQGDSGGSEDQFLIANSLWDGCAAGATEDQKKNTTLIMAVTILHETAHWKEDVKKFSDNDDDSPPEEGNELERDLFGGIITEDGGVIYRDGVAVDAATRDEWLNHDSWPSPAGGARAFSLSQELPHVQAQAGSDLEVTISLPKTTFELGEEIPVDVVYKNVGAAPIQVMNRVVLEGWPLHFNIINQQTGARVRFLGPELKLRIVSADFTTLQPNGTLTQTVNLVRDPTTSARRYQLLSSGTYNITAVYETFRGVQESTSNTLAVTIGTGGSISGTVTNATNGQSISGATVKVMENASVLTTATTSTNGTYSFPELPPGTYTLEARASGFLRSTRENIQVIAGQSTVVNFNISPLLAAGETRLVLTWGENPRDLDSHLWLPDTENTRYHVYYSNKGDNDEHPFAALDVDDTSSYGPETITITQRYSTGTYVYAVYNYAGSGDLTTSQAQVQVFDSTGLVATFNVPSVGTGRWWNLLTINGATGSITEVNQISENSPAPY